MHTDDRILEIRRTGVNHNQACPRWGCGLTDSARLPDAAKEARIDRVGRLWIDQLSRVLHLERDGAHGLGVDVRGHFQRREQIEREPGLRLGVGDLGLPTEVIDRAKARMPRPANLAAR
jgi:hypothetical protein